MELSRYETLSGFNKAFYAVYGVSSSVFAATCGRVLMSEPEFLTIPPLLWGINSILGHKGWVNPAKC